MSLLTRFLAPRERRSSLSSPSPEMLALLRGGRMTSAAGVTVTVTGALGYAAVLAAVRVLAESVAGLPAILYRRDGQDRRRAAEHRVYRLLHDGPNTRMTAFEFFELGMIHVATWGNFYAEKERDRAGRVLALWPLRPDLMQVAVGDDERLLYLYPGAPAMEEEDVLHVRGMGGDGVVGYSLIKLAREAIGLGMAAERFGSTVFLNGATPGVVLQHPGRLTDEAYQNLKASWVESHGGLENAHKPAILEEGMTLEKMGLPPEDAQFLQTRRFQVEEIARIYRVPLHLLQDLERATFSNIEHQSLDFVVHTLRPWLVRWEQSLARQLLTAEERQQYYVEFLVDALLRGDTTTRYNAYGLGRQWGWLSANDVRRLENMDQIKGGDSYLTPLNMTGNQMTREGQTRRTVRGERRRIAGMSGSGVRAATGRRRVMEGYRPALKDVMQRVVNREANDLLNAARRILGRRGVVEWDGWLDGFYEEHIDFMRDYLAPVFGSYAILVSGELEEETGETVVAEDVQAFLEPYTASRARVYGARHKAEVKAAAAEAQAAGEDPEAAVRKAVERLQEDEAERFAQDESVRLGNALARAILPLLGVMALRWVAFGDSCEYCQSLDGRTVGASAWFLAEGETLTNGAGVEYRPGGNVGHPPLHAGCDCMIVSG